jgi:hypothetical protein
MPAVQGLLDQPDPLLGSVAPTAMAAADDSMRSTGLDIGARPGFHLGLHGCTACPVEMGAAPAIAFATLEWVDWFNTRRLLEPIGNIPPVEAEDRYYASLELPARAA